MVVSVASRGPSVSIAARNVVPAALVGIAAVGLVVETLDRMTDNAQGI